MPKATKRKTSVKALASKKKKLSPKDMKKVKAGHNYESLTSANKKAQGLLLPAVQKVRE